MLVSRNGQVAKAVGWVSRKLPYTKGDATAEATAALLVPMPGVKLSFDLDVHTAQSLSRVLHAKQAKDGVVRRIKASEALPSQIAGKRPTVKPEDGPEKSRHTLVKQAATLKLAFNCFNAPFQVSSWTGHAHPFEKLPLEGAFDLISKGTRRKLGRIKLAARPWLVV